MVSYLFLGIFCVAVLWKNMLYVLPFQVTHSQVLGSYTHLQVVSWMQVQFLLGLSIVCIYGSLYR